jgi:hypothetical protein
VALRNPAAVLLSHSLHDSLCSIGIIHQVFQGFVEVETEKEVVLPDGSKKTESSNSVVPFLNLSLDVPAAPLFKDESEKNIIPQIPIFDLLTKYDGRSITVLHFIPV